MKAVQQLFVCNQLTKLLKQITNYNYECFIDISCLLNGGA